MATDVHVDLAGVKSQVIYVHVKTYLLAALPDLLFICSPSPVQPVGEGRGGERLCMAASDYVFRNPCTKKPM